MQGEVASFTADSCSDGIVGQLQNGCTVDEAAVDHQFGPVVFDEDGPHPKSCYSLATAIGDQELAIVVELAGHLHPPEIELVRDVAGCCHRIVEGDDRVEALCDPFVGGLSLTEPVDLPEASGDERDDQ